MIEGKNKFYERCKQTEKKEKNGQKISAIIWKRDENMSLPVLEKWGFLLFP